MAIALIVDFSVDPERAEEFAEALVRNARLSLEWEAGCRQFDVCRSVEEPHIFFLYEVYDDEAAIATHLNAANFEEFDRITRNWVTRKQVRRYPRVLP